MGDGPIDVGKILPESYGTWLSDVLTFTPEFPLGGSSGADPAESDHFLAAEDV